MYKQGSELNDFAEIMKLIDSKDGINLPLAPALLKIQSADYTELSKSISLSKTASLRGNQN